MLEILNKSVLSNFTYSLSSF